MGHARIGRVRMKAGGADVIPLRLVQVGEDVRLDADFMLEAAKGRPYDRLVIIGEVEGEDDLYVAGNTNAGESLILIELAKLQIVEAF